MLHAFFKEDLDEQLNLGVTLFTGRSAEQQREYVKKVLVGHHPSSKMIVTPTQDWTIRGMCSADCTGVADVDEVDVMAASLHYGQHVKSAAMMIPLIKTENGVTVSVQCCNND